MKTIFFPIFFACFISSASGQLTEADFTTFRDARFPYSLRYPRSWLSVEPSHQATRFKIVSDAGAGTADFSINVIPKPEAKEKPAAAYYSALKDDIDGSMKLLRRNIPTAVLVSNGETKVANMPAYFLMIDFTQQGGDISIPLRMLIFSFGRDGYTYTMTMRSYQEDWDTNKSIFDYIAFSFAYDPTRKSP